MDTELVTEIIKRADIVEVISHYINVIKKGRNYVAICPFHDDKNPSLQISKEKQIYKCFSCGNSGNVITFVKNYEKISFIEAIRKVAEIIGFNDDRLNSYSVKREVDVSLVPLHKCINDLTDYYQYALTTEEGAVCDEYLSSRHIDMKLQQEYRLGYAFIDPKKSIDYLKSKGNSLKSIEDIGIAGTLAGKFTDHNAGRFIVPICDYNGQVIGFSARRMNNDKSTPKYVNSPETPLFKKNNVLFNYHLAKETAKHDGFIYVLEGFMDVFALRRIGITSCVAIMGTALTSNHINQLRRLGVEVRMCLDGDEPGQNATMKCCEALDQAGLQYRIVLSKDDLRDPDEILNESGPDALKKYLNQLVDKASFSMQYFTSNKKLVTAKEKENFINQMMPSLLRSTNKVEVENYLVNIAKKTDLRYETIKELYEESKKKAATKELDFVGVKFKDNHPERKALLRYEAAERAALYQMLNSEEAVEYYEKEIGYFYNVDYNRIANYIMDLYESTGKVDEQLVVSLISSDEDAEAAKLGDSVVELLLENTHGSYSKSTMDDIKGVIVEERKKLEMKTTVDEAIKNKDPLEQARILDQMYKKER